MPLTQNDLRRIDEVIQKNNQVLRNDIAKFKDDIVHEVVAMREELTIVQGHRDQLEEHEGRLGVIETRLNISPVI